MSDIYCQLQCLSYTPVSLYGECADVMQKLFKFIKRRPTYSDKIINLFSRYIYDCFKLTDDFTYITNYV